jgi:hypothetical protein
MPYPRDIGAIVLLLAIVGFGVLGLAYVIGQALGLY